MEIDKSRVILFLGILFSFVITNCSGVGTIENKLVGRWAPETAELGGNEFPVAGFAGANLNLTEDGYEFAGDRGTYEIISLDSPVKMDIHGIVGPNAGKTIKSISELIGDQLTICYQLGSGERPEVFNSPKETKVLLVRYKRVL